MDVTQRLPRLFRLCRGGLVSIEYIETFAGIREPIAISEPCLRRRSHLQLCSADDMPNAEGRDKCNAPTTSAKVNQNVWGFNAYLGRRRRSSLTPLLVSNQHLAIEFHLCFFGSGSKQRRGYAYSFETTDNGSLRIAPTALLRLGNCYQEHVLVFSPVFETDVMFSVDQKASKVVHGVLF